MRPLPRTGFGRWFRIIRMLHDAEATGGLLTAEIAEGSDAVLDVALYALNQMRTLGLIRRELSGNSFRWRLGKDEDITTRSGTKVQPLPEMIAFAVLMRLMMGGTTVVQAAKAMGVTKATVEKHIRNGRKIAGLFAVVGYIQTGTGAVRWVYRFAPGQPDAQYVPKTRQERNADYARCKRVRRERAQLLARRAANSSIFRLAQAA